MHTDWDSLTGGGHEMIHHDAHQHDPLDEVPLLTPDSAIGAMQLPSLGTNTAHLLQDTVHTLDTNHGLDHHDPIMGLETHDQRGWLDVNSVGHESHLHLLNHSDAQDSNGDGVSDAASRDLHIDPLAAQDHQSFSVTWHDAQGHVHDNHGKDSDGDGWADNVERTMGTDPYNADSHPSLVEAHHFPAGSDENLPGTVDVTPSSSPWLLP